jgi:hypothetical protein
MTSQQAETRQLAKYQVAFLNRQFIKIMCANGVPHNLMVELFQDSVENIKGMKARVRAGRVTKDDYNTMGLCSDVSWIDSLEELISCSFPYQH